MYTESYFGTWSYSNENKASIDANSDTEVLK